MQPPLLNHKAASENPFLLIVGWSTATRVNHPDDCPTPPNVLLTTDAARQLNYKMISVDVKHFLVGDARLNEAWYDRALELFPQLA
jgi:hypothetical protein